MMIQHNQIMVSRECLSACYNGAGIRREFDDGTGRKMNRKHMVDAERGRSLWLSGERVFEIGIPKVLHLALFKWITLHC